jgi:hypothetical protein
MKSLNTPFRYAKLNQITQENFALLKRIKSTSSVYSTAKWKQQRKRSVYLAKNISKNAGRISNAYNTRELNQTGPIIKNILRERACRPKTVYMSDSGSEGDGDRPITTVGK